MALCGGALCPPGVPEAAGGRQSLGALPVACCWGIRLWLFGASLWGLPEHRGAGSYKGAPHWGSLLRASLQRPHGRGGEGVPAPLHSSCVVPASLGPLLSCRAQGRVLPQRAPASAPPGTVCSSGGEGNVVRPADWRRAWVIVEIRWIHFLPMGWQLRSPRSQGVRPLPVSGQHGSSPPPPWAPLQGLRVVKGGWGTTLPHRGCFTLVGRRLRAAAISLPGPRDCAEAGEPAPGNVSLRAGPALLPIHCLQGLSLHPTASSSHGAQGGSRPGLHWLQASSLGTVPAQEGAARPLGRKHHEGPRLLWTAATAGLSHAAPG